MRWLRALLNPSEPPEDRHRRELAELREQLAGLSATVSRLKTEWAAEQLALSDLVGKMNAWVGRLSARERKKAEQRIEESQVDAFDHPPAAAARDARQLSKPELRQLAAKLRNGGKA